jgi:hypothetical protein
MANVVTYQRHWQRRGTAAALAAANEVLYAGEWCLESDTGYVKIGDGVTAWNALDYLPIVAADMPYSNGVSGLTASNVQDAIDELAGGGGGGGGNTDPRMGIIDPAYDMLCAIGSGSPWVQNFVSGTFTVTSINGGNSAPGVYRLSTGSGTADRGAITLGSVPNIAVGAGAIVLPYRFRVPTLSDGTNTFAVSVGLANDYGAATERIILNYAHSANAGALRLVTTAASTTTIVNGSGSALVANTLVSGHIAVNAAGTQVDLYQGTTLIATSTTNIPTAAMLAGAALVKSAGTTARTLDVDYLGPPQITFTTPR